MNTVVCQGTCRPKERDLRLNKPGWKEQLGESRDREGKDKEEKRSHRRAAWEGWREDEGRERTDEEEKEQEPGRRALKALSEGR
ncbi:hypothetical protein N7488_001272 [Penicillium malachiteum]|nr:hypothetical protein N7488_001272 [Penicillium malachiteum]